MMANEVPIYLGKKKQLVVGKTIFQSINDWELTERERQITDIELGETEEVKERCLRELKKILADDEDVRYRTDDPYLLRFLRFKKYDIKKTYETLKSFYNFRNNKHDFFTIPPSSVQNQNAITFLPYTDEEGRIVFCVNLDYWNSQEVSFEEICTSIWTVLDIVTLNPKVQINGIICIWDFQKFTFHKLTAMMRKNRFLTIVSFMQKSYPMRIKKVILFNTGRLGRILYSFIQPVLSKKISERITVIDCDFNELHKYVNPVILPKKFGGSLDDEDYDVSQQVADNLPYLKYERSFILAE